MFFLGNLKAKKILTISISNPYFYDNLITLRGQKAEDFIKAMDTDFKDCTYKEFTDIHRTYARAEIKFTQKNEAGTYDTNFVYQDILMSDENTIKWLDSNGYGDILELLPEMIKHVTVYKYDFSDENTDAQFADTKDTAERAVTIKDQKQIQEILDSGQRDIYDYNKYYTCQFTFNDNLPQMLNHLKEYSHDTSEYYGYSLQYSFDNVPDFISELFE